MRFPETIEEFRSDHPDVTREVYGDHNEHYAGLNLPDMYLDMKKVPCRKTNKSVDNSSEENMLKLLFRNLSGTVPGMGKRMQAIKDGEGPEIKVLAATPEKNGVMNFLGGSMGTSMGGSSVGRLALTDGASVASTPTRAPDVGLGALRLQPPMPEEATHLLAQRKFCSDNVIYCSLYLHTLRSFITRTQMNVG